MTTDGTGTGQGNSGESTQGSEAAAPEKKFTQEEVNAIVARKTAQHERALKKSGPSLASFLSELGFDNAEDLKDALEQKSVDADASAEAVKAAKKAQRDAITWQGKAETFEAQLAKMTAASNAGKVQSAIFEAAGKVNANPKLTHALASVDNRVGIDEDGCLFVRDEKGEPQHGMTVDKYIAQMVADEPSLKHASPGTGSGSVSSQAGAISAGDPPPKEAGPEMRAWQLRQLTGGGAP